MSGRYPSRKMGVVIQFESHRVELAIVHEMERDPDVLEYYDQPPSFPLEYQDRNDRPLVVQHTPDYFAIRRESAGWEECKTEQELNQLDFFLKGTVLKRMMKCGQPTCPCHRDPSRRRASTDRAARPRGSP